MRQTSIKKPLAVLTEEEKTPERVVNKRRMTMPVTPKNFQIASVPSAKGEQDTWYHIQAQAQAS